VRRRQFITLLGGAMAWPLAARAQQAGGMRRIGVLQGLAANDSEGQDRFDALLHALQQLGWSDGRNIQIVHRFTNGDADRARAYAAELVALAPDLILTSGASTLGVMLQSRYNEATSTYIGIDGSVRKSVVVRGNCAARSCTVRTYDANGRFTGTGIRRGNVLYSYDSNGHRIARVVYNSSNNGFTAYNNRGRYVGSGTR
jgi:YD repeat-containing protein